MSEVDKEKKCSPVDLKQEAESEITQKVYLTSTINVKVLLTSQRDIEVRDHE